MTAYALPSSHGPSVWDGVQINNEETEQVAGDVNKTVVPVYSHNTLGLKISITEKKRYASFSSQLS